MSIIPTTILDHLDTIAVISGGLFAGSAFFVSYAETPALHEFGLNEHWRYFPLMYKRAAASQASFSAIAAAAGIAHATRIEGSPFDRNLWLIAGSTFLAIIPFTVLIIGRTNKKIIEDNKSVKSGNESKINIGTKKELLDQWAVLHLVRTVASVAGFGAMQQKIENLLKNNYVRDGTDEKKCIAAVISFEIRQNNTALDIEYFSEFLHEKEVLVVNNAIFKIIHVATKNDFNVDIQLRESKSARVDQKDNKDGILGKRHFK